MIKKCLKCKADIDCWPYEFKSRKYCSFSCRSQSQKATNWKGGKSFSGQYVRVWVSGKYVPEHRYLMEKKIGRKLLPGEIVHHANHNKTDNRLVNLFVMKRSEHATHHHAGLLKPKSIAGLRRWYREAERCGKPITGWWKRPSGAPCQKPVPCPMH